MAITAVTRIRHGKSDGKVVEFGIGDNVEGLSDDDVRSLVAAGSVIETGSERKFSNSPTITPEDAETLKRDELLAKANMAASEPTETTSEGGAEPPSGTNEGKTVETTAGNQQTTGTTPTTTGGSSTANTGGGTGGSGSGS